MTTRREFLSGMAMAGLAAQPVFREHAIRSLFRADAIAGDRSPVSLADDETYWAEIQRAFPQLPIVGSGYSYLQAFLPNAGAANLRDGRATFVGVGRATLAQPDFVRQLQEHGKLDRKRICRTFSYCTALMRSKHNELGQFATGCPPFDKEIYGPIWEQAKKK